MNNIPIFPPAERFGLALIALIRAIAAQAGWFVPRWLVAKVEADIWGFVEALSLLVAVVKEANLAAAAVEPDPQPVQGTNNKARPRGTAQNRRARTTRMATALPEAGKQEAAAPRRPRLSPPRPNRRHGRRPGRHATGLRPRSDHAPPRQKTSQSKPAPWHALIVTLSEH